jgi:WhiB family redox-sensing transcriptional regulator
VDDLFAPEPWEYSAECPKHQDKDWFSTDQYEKYAARAVCVNSCPVRKECIETALNSKLIHGIWGGVDDYEIRRALSVDAYGEPAVRTRSPRCPLCLKRNLDISGVKTRDGYRTECMNSECGLVWNMATIPTTLRKKKTAK